MLIDLDDLFDGGGFEEGGGHTLLNAEDDAFRRGDLVSLENINIKRKTMICVMDRLFRKDNES
jgi:hypothetical protein